MRTSSAALLLALAACAESQQEESRAAEQRAVEAAPKFFCAQGEAELLAECTAERARTAQGRVTTIRHPDGHFRRLLVSDDGTQVTAADGADPVSATRTGDQIEIVVGNDRYRLPTTR
ncbi:MAG: hypothetical protein JWN21_1168 [Sphingomonas bacterium]|uniref:hypothetical protein n=1 Tax=Sphingomonas bacterium TaxID=1895847 RepID=UPI00262CE412|nr:hypothetical protein [Sphingomonas bacterium]MDB5695625.1 hypothetical protein [Sphingomonas bacterium]